MTFSRNNVEGGHPAGHISNKTLYIALNYQDVAAAKSKELYDDLAEELFLMERKKSRLEYYMTLLPDSERNVIRMCFFERKTLKDVAGELGVSIWYVRRHKDDGIDRLTNMYAYVNSKTN